MKNLLTIIAVGLFLLAHSPGNAAWAQSNDVKGEEVWNPLSGYKRDVFVASTRLRDADRLADRGNLWFAKFNVSREQRRKRNFLGLDLGQTRLREHITPKLDDLFTRDSAGNFPSQITNRAATMKQRLRAALRKSRSRTIFLYVHGFNNSFGEGVTRAAELAAMTGFDGVTVHYSWPSSGQVPGYLYDRESSLFARRGLVTILRLLTQLRREGTAHKLVIIAHSMGAFLTMEALSDMAIGGEGWRFSRIDNLTLASADIDLDVFSEQTRLLKSHHSARGLLRKTVVLVARGDLALAGSDIVRLSHTGNRVGSVEDVQAAFCKLAVNVIDISDQRATGTLRHNTFTSTATARAFLRRLIHNPALTMNKYFSQIEHGTARFHVLKALKGDGKKVGLEVNPDGAQCPV